MRVRFLPVLAFLLATSGACGADHPVTTPAEAHAAIAAARPGDTITLRDGPWTDADLLFEAEGTADAPITLRAQTPGAVVISGHSRLRIAGRHLVVHGLFFRQAWHEEDLIAFRRDSKRLASDCHLTECAVVDCNAPGAAETRWVSIYGQGHQVDRCWIQGKTSRGTTLVVWLSEAAGGHRIDGNYFGPRPRLGKNGGETIRIGDSKTSAVVARVTVEGNCFEECDGEAEIISNKSCENVYRGNTFRRCAGALTLRHGDRCLVESNFFFGEGAAGTGGVRIIGANHTVVNNYFADLRGTDQRATLCLVNGLRNSPANGYFAAENAVIAFNTVVNCRVPLLIGHSDEDAGNDLPPLRCTIANNVILGPTPAVLIRTEPVDLKVFGNHASGDSGGLPPPAGFSLLTAPAERAPEGVVRLARPIPASGDFPAIRDDLDGQPRPGEKHAGCDQHSASLASRHPLTRATTGPTWLAEALAVP